MSYEGAGEHPVGVKLYEIHHFFAVLHVLEFGILLSLYYLLFKITIKLFLSFYFDETVWGIVTRVRDH